MIPGTKARAQPGEKKPATENSPTAAELKRQQEKSLEKIQEPSTRHYSRRALFTQLPALFGEGLTKILRTSNHLERKLLGGEKKSSK